MIGPYMTSQEIKGIVLEDQPAADDPWQVIKIDADGNVDFCLLMNIWAKTPMKFRI